MKINYLFSGAYKKNAIMKYSNQKIDKSINGDIKANSFGYKAIETSAEGNCLYCAISISVFGDEDAMIPIKLGALFMLFEYKSFFVSYLNRTGSHHDYENFVFHHSKMEVWGNMTMMLAISMLFNRPIYNLAIYPKPAVANKPVGDQTITVVDETVDSEIQVESEQTIESKPTIATEQIIESKQAIDEIVEVDTDSVQFCFINPFRSEWLQICIALKGFHFVGLLPESDLSFMRSPTHFYPGNFSNFDFGNIDLYYENDKLEKTMSSIMENLSSADKIEKFRKNAKKYEQELGKKIENSDEIEDDLQLDVADLISKYKSDNSKIVSNEPEFKIEKKYIGINDVTIKAIVAANKSRFEEICNDEYSVIFIFFFT